MYTVGAPGNTFFSFAVSNTPLSNTSIRDDTQNEQVRLQDGSRVSCFSFVT